MKNYLSQDSLNVMGWTEHNLIKRYMRERSQASWDALVIFWKSKREYLLMCWQGKVHA